MQIPVTGINSDLGSGKSIRNRMDSDPQHWLWECTVNVLSIIKLASDAVNYSAYLLPPGADSSGLEWSRNWKFILIPPEVSSVISDFSTCCHLVLIPPGWNGPETGGSFSYLQRSLL